MSNQSQCTRLCPFSVGLALGMTSGLAVVLWSLWAMFYGVPPMMMAHGTINPTWHGGMMHAVMALVKGFVFGFVFAFIYDWILCIGGKSCKKSGGCHSCETETESSKKTTK